MTCVLPDFTLMTLTLPDCVQDAAVRVAGGGGGGQTGPSPAQTSRLSSSSPAPPLMNRPFGPLDWGMAVTFPAKAGVAKSGFIVSFFRVLMMSTDWFCLSVSP